MSGQYPRRPHNTFNFNINETSQLNISSDFDSGNLQTAESIDFTQQSTFKLKLTPALQPFNPAFSNKPSTKTFFHFSAKCTDTIVIHAVIKRMTILSYLEGSFDQMYRICIGKKANPYVEPEYKKVKPEYLKLNKQNDQYSLQFQYRLQANQRIYFAYHYPYSVQKLVSHLHEINEQVHKRNISEKFQLNNRFLYFRNELLIESIQSRPVNLLSLTQIPRNRIQPKNLEEYIEVHKTKLSESKHTNCQILLNNAREPRISKTLFPYFDLEERPYKFQKPYLLITCRVHPGQTSASFALQGLLNELIRSDSPGIQFLLKSFVLLVVPMVNPDGVYNGTYRMDTLGQNLNRFYNNCVSHKQPSIFAIQTLMNHYAEQLLLFFDIHSHPQLKGSFFYGNAYTSIYDQIQSQVFAKLLAINSECFSFQNSSFSQRNMNSKDANELLTKDGSARVYAFKKMTYNIHCYTIQMGYHGAPIKKSVASVEDREDLAYFKTQYRRCQRYFSDIDYQQHGASLAFTIAQLYIHTMSSFQGQGNSSQKSEHPLSQLREQMGKQINQKQERFKMMDGGLNKKLKTVNLTISQNMYAKILKKFPILEDNFNKFKQGRKKKVEVSTIEIVKQKNGLEKPYKSETLRSIANDKKEEISSYTPHQFYKPTSTDLSVEQRTINHKISAARHLSRVLKQKINITPFQFDIPAQRKRCSVNSHQSKDNDMLNFKNLPKLNKKPLKAMSDRQKMLRQRRIASSMQKDGEKGFLDDNQKYFNKMTIDSQLNEIIDVESIINCNNYRQFNDDEIKNQTLSSSESEKEIDERNTKIFGDQINTNMNSLHMKVMYRKESESRNNSSGNKNIQYKVIRNYQTQKVSVNKYQEKIISGRKNPQRQFFNKNTFLPKLQIKSDKITSKYDFELKMHEKLDKEFKLSDSYNKLSKKGSDPA